VEPLDDGVDLGAQAGGEDDDLGEVGTVPEVAEGLRELGVAHRHALEHVERHGALVEPYDDDRHV
jgi:hypothetical protein